MKNALLVMTLLCAVAVAPAVAADQAGGERSVSARTYQFKFRDAGRAAVLIKPLITGRGSVSIQPSSNTLTVTDSVEALSEITRIIEQYDAPAKGFRVEVKVVAASRGPAAAPVPEDLREISTKLSGVLRFNRFEKLGEIVANGKEGDPVLVDLQGTYRASFQLGEFDPLSQSLRLGDFKLLRVPEGGGEVQQLLNTASLNLRVDQTVVLGASRLPDSNRVLMLVLLARRAD